MGPGESETQTPAEPSGLASVLDRAFGLNAAGTTMPTELRAGLATFLTMAYIMYVNPAILEKAGMDHGAVFVATCLAAALSTAIMGLYANYPIALAPGMPQGGIYAASWSGSSAHHVCSQPGGCGARCVACAGVPAEHDNEWCRLSAAQRIHSAKGGPDARLAAGRHLARGSQLHARVTADYAALPGCSVLEQKARKAR